MSATTTTVTLPSGEIASRTSKTMSYTHAIVATWGDRAEGVVSWSQSAANAEKAARSLRSRGYVGVRVVEVDAEPAVPARPAKAKLGVESVKAGELVVSKSGVEYRAIEDSAAGASHSWFTPTGPGALRFMKLANVARVEAPAVVEEPAAEELPAPAELAEPAWTVVTRDAGARFFRPVAGAVAGSWHEAQTQASALVRQDATSDVDRVEVYTVPAAGSPGVAAEDVDNVLVVSHRTGRAGKRFPIKWDAEPRHELTLAGAISWADDATAVSWISDVDGSRKAEAIRLAGELVARLLPATAGRGVGISVDTLRAGDSLAGYVIAYVDVIRSSDLAAGVPAIAVVTYDDGRTEKLEGFALVFRPAAELVAGIAEEAKRSADRAAAEAELFAAGLNVS